MISLDFLVDVKTAQRQVFVKKRASRGSLWSDTAGPRLVRSWYGAHS